MEYDTGDQRQARERARSGGGRTLHSYYVKHKNTALAPPTLVSPYHPSQTTSVQKLPRKSLLVSSPSVISSSRQRWGPVQHGACGHEGHRAPCSGETQVPAQSSPGKAPVPATGASSSPPVQLPSPPHHLFALPPLRSLHSPEALQKLPCRDKTSAKMPNTCIFYSRGDEQGRQRFLPQPGPGALGCSRRQSSGKPKTCQVMLFHAAFFNTTALRAQFGGTHAGCVHPAPLLPLKPWERGWERGPGEKPRPKAAHERGARPNWSNLPRQAAAGSAHRSWGCRQRGQTATSRPSSLRVSFTDLPSLSHCPSNDSGAELPPRGARHESHPNGIPVTAGITPGSQVYPALLPLLHPSPAGSSGAGQQRKSPVGHLWGQPWGCGMFRRDPAASWGAEGSWGEARLCAMPAAQKKLLSSSKRCLSPDRDRLKSRVQASPSISRCLAPGRVLPPLPRQQKDARTAGSRRDTSRSLCPWGQCVLLPVMKSRIASRPRSGPRQAARGKRSVQQGGGSCHFTGSHILPIPPHMLLSSPTPRGCPRPTGPGHAGCFPKGIVSCRSIAPCLCRRS